MFLAVTAVCKPSVAALELALKGLLTLNTKTQKHELHSAEMSSSFAILRLGLMMKGNKYLLSIFIQ